MKARSLWPLLALVVFAGLMFLYMKSDKKLTLVSSPDTADYAWPVFPLSKSLAAPRTLGYPLFLKVVRRVSPSMELLPVCHYAMHAVAVFVFYLGLRRLGMAGWPAAAVAGSLLCTVMFHTYAGYVLTDCLASSMMIMTIGFLLMAVGRPGGRVAWVGYTAALFFTYQVRPAYLFLLGLLPLLGLAILRMTNPAAAWAGRWKKMAAGLTGAALLPFLAFCALRGYCVGHFGLVSFGGVNVIGVAGQLLTADMIDDLPEDVRPLATRAVNERREAIDVWHKKVGVVPRPDWQPTGFVADASGTHLVYTDLVQMYNANIWGVWGRFILEEGEPELVGMNRRMMQVAKAIIVARPGRYLKWLKVAFLEGTGYTVTQYTAPPVLANLFLFALFYHGFAILRRCRWGAAEAAPDTLDPRRAFDVVFLIAASVFLCKLGLVILVEPPIPRYMDAAGALLVTVPVALIACRKPWAAIGEGAAKGTETSPAAAPAPCSTPTILTYDRVALLVGPQGPDRLQPSA
jgi:hypothetical protein